MPPHIKGNKAEINNSSLLARDPVNFDSTRSPFNRLSLACIERTKWIKRGERCDQKSNSYSAS
jgi:hypothetical protein